MTKKNVGIEDKIEHIMDETRVVLPGTQALLGFQLNAFFSATFKDIDQLLKNVHLMSLGFIALATIILMTPVAYHQIVEKGDVSKHLYTLSSRLLITAMVMLALGMASDIFVVVMLTTNSYLLASIASVCHVLIAYSLWFFYTIFKRKKIEHNKRLKNYSL